MPVSKMKRLLAIVGRDDCDELIKRLVWLSCVDVDASPQLDGCELARADTADERRKTEERLSCATNAIELLSQRNTVKRKLLSPKPELRRGGEPEERVRHAEELTDEAYKLYSQLERIRSERVRLEAEADSLKPWAEYDLPLSAAGTRKTDIILGCLPSGVAFEPICGEIEDKCCAHVKQVLNADGVSYLSIICHIDDTAVLSRILAGAGFVRAPVTVYDGTASEELDIRRDAISALDTKRDKLLARADELAASISEVEMYSDTERTNLTFTEAKGRTAETESTSILSGWVPEDSVDEVVSELEAVGCAYELTDPQEDDDVPVLLKNNGFAAPFEPVVALYSMPKYGTYDPTFIMSIFYIIIFGLMFADFGYGAIVSGVCLLALRLMRPRGSLKKFLQMFAICGASCMVMGILFGGYFGDLPTKMAVNMFGAEKETDLALWMNPVNDPMPFLILSLAVGALHLVAGFCIKFYVLCKTQTFLDALFDAGGWIIVFLGAGTAIAGGMFVPALGTVGIVLVISGYALLICTQGRREKKLPMKIVKGLLALYDTVSYVSDLLSYSRILSLGLASAVIASVFNLLGTMGGFSFGGVLIFIFVILIGHTLNIAINLLGAFVHASRLQYIEFFGKFYEDGGRAFMPLEPMAKYYVYKEKI